MLRKTPLTFSCLAGLPHQPSIFGTDQYKQKPLVEWLCEDVFDWLSGLDLSEYGHAFFERNITGIDLTRLNRASFIQLNVTRVSHRKIIEDSIRDYVVDKSDN